MIKDESEEEEKIRVHRRLEDAVIVVQNLDIVKMTTIFEWDITTFRFIDVLIALLKIEFKETKLKVSKNQRHYTEDKYELIARSLIRQTAYGTIEGIAMSMPYAEVSPIVLGRVLEGFKTNLVINTGEKPYIVGPSKAERSYHLYPVKGDKTKFVLERVKWDCELW